MYRLQGVKINDKHVEVIVRQMLQKWEISDSGETTLLKGEHVDKVEFDEANAKAEAKGLRPAQGQPILLGPRRGARRIGRFQPRALPNKAKPIFNRYNTQGSRLGYCFLCGPFIACLTSLNGGEGDASETNRNKRNYHPV